MWGIQNVTGSNVTFRRVSLFGIELITGFFEEITFNITSAQPAGAFEISEIEIPSKTKIINSTSAVAISVVTSSSVQKQTLKLIGGATANLINYI